MPSTIFSLSLRGLGRHNQWGSNLLSAAGFAGLISAPLTGVLADKYSTRVGFAIPLGLMVACLFTFPLFINFYRAGELDGWRESEPLVKTNSEDASSRVSSEPSPVLEKV